MSYLIFILIIIFIAITLSLAIALSKARYKLSMHDQEVRKLIKERDEAKEESLTKDRYVQNMSHEIRTPLNAVVGFAQLLALPPETLTDEERSEYAEHIQHNSNMLTMLIDDILNISDIKSGNYSITLSDNQLNAICNAVLASVKYRIRPNVTLSYQTDISDDYFLRTDARRVQQILINYLTNAIKHTASGSITLTTSLTENPGNVTFAVTDTGEGVPPSKAETVFKRFTKLNDLVQGTGLGLNICLILSGLLHGRVFLDTTYTKGARFVLCLPVETPDETEAQSK